jgi:AAA family ATP:ADP antiporter
MTGLRRLVVLRAGEGQVTLAAFGMLLCLFASYSVLRPIRETMGITSGVENLPYLFWGTFAAMLVAQPLYGWLTSRFRRTVFLPWVYLFFTANILAFYAWFNLEQDHTWIARAYYVWVSVFSFFIVAVFWGFMADVFTREQAGRLFGCIAAGASTGGLVGPFLAGQLAVPLGTLNLLPLSAGLLASSLIFMTAVLRWQRQFGTGVRGAQADSPLGGAALGGFRQLLRSPYLLGIALFVVLVSWANTFLYLQQQALVARAFATSNERTRFFSTIDFLVQALALLIQIFVFGRLFKRVGLRVMLASVPALMIVGYALYALVPAFAILVPVFALRRVGEYAITRPCRDSLFTVVSREEKYKAKSLIDTFIYRAGDVSSASVHKLLTAVFGFGPSGIGWFGAASCCLWFLLALVLGKAQANANAESAERG